MLQEHQKYMERGLVSITIKVEKITKFKKDYLVFFSKDIVLTLLEDELILYNIYKGKVITHEELREIDSLHIFHKYYFILKKKLLINLLSIEDARKYLKSKDLDNKLIEDIINKLKAIDCYTKDIKLMSLRLLMHKIKNLLTYTN